MGDATSACGLTYIIPYEMFKIFCETDLSTFECVFTMIGKFKWAHQNLILCIYRIVQEYVLPKKCTGSVMQTIVCFCSFFLSFYLWPLWYLQTVLFLLLDECLVLYMHQLLHVNDFDFMLIMFYLIIETFHQRLLLLENNLFYETNIQISNSSLLLSLPNKLSLVWETYFPLANEVARGYSNAISWYIRSPQESLEPY